MPTAERDPAVGLGIFGPVFRSVRAIMYNSHEERAMIQAAAGNADVPGVVVGRRLGACRTQADAQRFRRKFKIDRPFAIYVGRIDENKGCKELFDYFRRYAATFPRGLDLVLIGSAIMPVPDHPRIHHLGFVSDEDKFDAMAAADLLIMPSYFESLSMVALEAWAMGKPVLANGRCDVLKGQCIRSGAGLYYESYEEFAETLYSLESNGPLHARLGRNGRDYFQRALRLAGDRAEVPGHARPAATGTGDAHDRTAARLVGAAEEGLAAGRRTCSPRFPPERRGGSAA